MHKTIDEHVQEFLKQYKDTLPNPTHYPKAFEFYARVYRNQVKQKETENT